MRLQTSFATLAAALMATSAASAQSDGRPQPEAPAPGTLGAPEGPATPAQPGDPNAVAPDFAETVPARSGEHFFLPAPTEAPATSDEELAAQGAVEMNLSARHDVVLHAEQADGLWARGRTYKARLASDGFTYIPFLGSSASRNYPLELAVESVEVGAVRVPIAGSASVTREGDRYVLDRGPLDVVYETAVDQVEQIFVVETGRLAGDLVVTLDVTTDLSPVPNGGGFGFEGPEGSVGYGAAIALDGAGGAVEVPATLEGGKLRLTVPAGFVAQCGGRVVIDPILTTYDVDTFSVDLTDPDAAYDLGTDDFMFVYEEDFSEVDTDVYFSRYSFDGATLADAGYVEVGAAKWADPEVATLNGSDVALIVATDEIAGAEDPIVGRVYDFTTDNFIAPSFEIGDTGGAVNWSNANPDVGGNSSTSTNTDFCVVWERTFSGGGTAVRFRTVGPDGTLGTQQFIGPSTGTSQPRISESTGNPSSVNVWNVVYAFEDAGTGDETINGFQLNADGTVNQANTTLLNVGSEVVEGLDVSDALSLDGLAPTYVAVYDDFGIGDADVEAVVLRENSFVNRVDVNVLEHALLSGNQNDPRLSTSSADFVVSYTELQGGEWTTYVTCLDLTEGSFLAVSERRTPLSPTTGTIVNGAGMASRFSGGSLGSRYVALAWENFDAVGGDYDIVGTTFFASNPQSPAFQYCDGVPNSTGDRGFIRLEGTRSATSNKTVVASALPPQQFSLLVAGSGQSSIPMAGGQGTLCLGGNLGRFNDQIRPIDVTGEVEFTLDPQDIPAGLVPYSAIVGDIYQFQVWHRDFVGFQTSNYTNAVTILWN